MTKSQRNEYLQCVFLDDGRWKYTIKTIDYEKRWYRELSIGGSTICSSRNLLLLFGIGRYIFSYTCLGIDSLFLDLSQLFLGHGLEC